MIRRMAGVKPMPIPVEVAMSPSDQLLRSEPSVVSGARAPKIKTWHSAFVAYSPDCRALS
jgi:hypothetical protein